MSRQGWQLTRTQRLTYSVGNFSTAFVTANVMAWILYYYSPPPNALDDGMVFLGAGLLVGWARLAGSLVDALTNPLIAFWSDRSTNPQGRRIPFIRRGLLPLVLFAVLLWFPPVRGGSVWNILWLALTLSGTWFFFTVVVAPYLALMPELTPHPGERVSLTVTMAYFEAAAIVFTTVGVPPLIEALEGGVQLGPLFLEDGYKITAILLALVGAAGFLVSVSRIRERPPAATQVTTLSLRRSIVECFRNPAFPPYLLAVAAAKIGMGLVMISLPFVATAVLHKGEGFVAVLVGPLFLSTIVGFVAGEAVVNRIGLKAAFRTATGLATGVTLAFFAVSFLGGRELPLREAREEDGEVRLLFGEGDGEEVRLPRETWDGLFPSGNRRFGEGLYLALPAGFPVEALAGPVARVPVELGMVEAPEAVFNLEGWTRLLSTPEERNAAPATRSYRTGPPRTATLEARVVLSDGSVTFTGFRLAEEPSWAGEPGTGALSSLLADGRALAALMARFDLRVELAWSVRIWVILGLFLLLGFPAAILMSMYRPIVCEIVDLDEQRVGSRREAIYFGVEGLLTKSADGVAAVVAPAVMLLGHLVAPPPLGYMLTFAAAGVFMVLAWWIFGRYPLGGVRRP
ncbi:MAG: MFS transporter [Deltaproteobacteria bacterium]|nr:MFS transporter [Deltaproteobacteria bacterium]